MLTVLADMMDFADAEGISFDKLLGAAGMVREAAVADLPRMN
jgi:hypothetical protein